MIIVKILGYIIVVPGFVMLSQFWQFRTKETWKERFKCLLLSLPFFAVGILLVKISEAF